MGLIGAIQNFIDNQTVNRPRITVKVPEHLPFSPAAYEVAVYRIALEGLTNVLRHADANTATVRISVHKEQLVVEILDDGSRLPGGFSSGVGLASMQERAEELGGTFELLSHRQGLHIRAYLPLLEE